MNTHVTMAKQVFYQFKALTQALDNQQLTEMFGHVSDATANYIIEKLGLERIDFVTEIVDSAILLPCEFDEMLEKLGVVVE